MTASALEFFTVKVTTPLALEEPEAAEIVELPLPAAKVTVLPETALLFESFKVTVIVEVVDPSADTELGEAATVELDAETAPAVKVTAAGVPIVVPPMVPVTCAVPVTVPEVSVAV